MHEWMIRGMGLSFRFASDFIIIVIINNIVITMFFFLLLLLVCYWCHFSSKNNQTERD